MSDFEIEKTLNTDSINITNDMLEIGLDSILEDGLLKDIPVFSTLISLTKIGINVKDRLFMKKLLYFLYETQSIPSTEREEMIKKINESDNYKTKVGEKLIFILDKADDFVKAKLIGQLFNAVLKNRLGYAMFIRCSETINNTFEPDLLWFLKRINPDSIEYIGGVEKESLINSGIMKAVSAEGATTMASSSFELKYIISDVGLCLKKYLGSKHVDYDDLLKELNEDRSENKW